MADRNLSYRVELNTTQARQSATQLMAVMRQVNQAAANSPEARAAAQVQIEQQRRVTQQVRTDSQVRIQAARAEAAERTQQARAAAQVQIEQERRITQAVRAEASTRARENAAAQRQAATSQGPFGGGLTGAIIGGAAGYFSIQGAQMIAQQTVAMAEYGTSIKQAAQSFDILSGGAAQAQANLLAIQRASGGSVDSFNAMSIGLQALSLGLAKTPAEFERLTTAALRVTQVSPVINDVNSAISELGLAAANTSYRRLDQLGLSVSEVKKRMDELKTANSELDDSQAFLAASVDLLVTKYADLPLPVSGVQSFKTAISELRTEISLLVNQPLDTLFSGLATGANTINVALGGGTLNSQRALVDQILADRQQQLASAEEGGLWSYITGAQSEREINQQQVEGLRQLQTALESVTAAVESGAPGAEKYAQDIGAIVREVANLGAIAPGMVDEINAAADAFERQQDVSQIYDSTAADLEKVRAEAAEAEAAQTRYADALGRVAELQSQAAALEGIPGADALASQINALATELLFSSTATQEQLDKLAELEAMTAGASGAADYFTGSTGAAAGATANWGINLTGVLGPLSAVESGAYATADAISVARAELAGFMAQQAAQRQFDQLQGRFQSQLASASQRLIPLTGTAGARAYYDQRAGAADDFIRGLQGQGLTDQQIQIELAGFIETQTAAAEQMVENAREQERAGKRAASEAERAMKKAASETEKAFKEAASNFVSDLKSTPGLFSTSNVTAEDMALAEAGAYTDKADEYLRRLRDEVLNGKDYEGVSIEEARAALDRIGIVASDNAKAALAQFEQAWENSSLFASKENLALINQEAVQQHQNLQEKIRTGQRNILEFFSETVDEALKPFILGEDVEVVGGPGGFTVTPRTKIDLSGVTFDGAAAAAGAGIDPTSVQAQLSALTVPPISVSSITVDPIALENVWTGLTPPAIVITEVSIGPNAQTSFTETLNTQFTSETAAEGYRAIGSRVGYYIESGITGRSEHLGMAGSLRFTIDGQLTGLKEEFTALGNDPARWVEQGFTSYTHGDMAQDFVTDLGTQFYGKIEDFKSHGAVIASIVEAGFTSHTHGDMALAFYNTLSGQFGGAGAHGEATNLDKFKSMGQTLAGQVEFGFNDPERTRDDMAGPMIIAIQTQFAQQEHIDSLKTVGETAGYWLEWGLTGYPWQGVATSLITEIQTGLAAQENIDLLIAAGKNNLGGPLVTGVIQAFNEADWSELADQVVTGVLTSLADAEG